MGCNNDSGLGFWLFDHFLIRVTPEQAFNGHIFNYTIEARDNEESVLIGRARLSDDGMLDGTIAIDQREAVLDHFLEKINGVYAALYAATERGESLTLATLRAAPRRRLNAMSSGVENDTSAIFRQK
ncbi:Formate hydrogenlyase regulatory protein hycA [Leclercia adecarboxylata]|uniref:Formate hydrogenlyase regulatory protein hycA n=1 Tax=Leclercia adecarboxylata TaxID=83655 RepID=A0A4U9IKI0_9ENTR|nr:Formate hydrogenlyase regulatory protein hycA [Leclercia adecarboxylata]